MHPRILCANAWKPVFCLPHIILWLMKSDWGRAKYISSLQNSCTQIQGVNLDHHFWTTQNRYYVLVWANLSLQTHLSTPSATHPWRPVHHHSPKFCQWSLAHSQSESLVQYNASSLYPSVCSIRRNISFSVTLLEPLTLSWQLWMFLFIKSLWKYCFLMKIGLQTSVCWTVAAICSIEDLKWPTCLWKRTDS